MEKKKDERKKYSTPVRFAVTLPKELASKLALCGGEIVCSRPAVPSSRPMAGHIILLTTGTGTPVITTSANFEATRKHAQL